MGEFDTTVRGRSVAYDGASQGYRMEQKGLQSGDQDTLAGRELKNLWRRSNHLCRNNAVAVTAEKRLVANWIGTGIGVRWVYEDGTAAVKVQKQYNQWAKECNYDGYGTFENLQASWGKAVYKNGESFTRMIISPRKTSKIPLALQHIEAHHLDPLFTNNGDPNTKNGITFLNTAPETYHFWKNHPESFPLTGSNPNTRIAVSANDVVHIFERDRPGQWRGIPMLAPVMLNIYEMDELVDATIQRQKAAQAVSWIIENTSKIGAFAPGSVKTKTEVDPNTGATKKKKVVQGTGGGVHYLEEGEQIKFSSVQDIGSNLMVLLADEWGKIASALGLSTHQLTGDLSDVNFSSIRAGLNELRIRVEMIQHHLFINLGLAPICNRWIRLHALYLPRIATTGVYPIYDLPRIYGVDEMKDAQADLLEVQAGFATLESKLQKRNTTFEQLVADRKKAEASGLVLTSVPSTLPAGTDPSRTRPPTTEDNKPKKQNGKATQKENKTYGQ